VVRLIHHCSKLKCQSDTIESSGILIEKPYHDRLTDEGNPVAAQRDATVTTRPSSGLAWQRQCILEKSQAARISPEHHRRRPQCGRHVYSFKPDVSKSLCGTDALSSLDRFSNLLNSAEELG
jgi:hypothetical protein